MKKKVESLQGHINSINLAISRSYAGLSEEDVEEVIGDKLSKKRSRKQDAEDH